MFKQTWWDNNLKTRFNEYLGWLGDSSADSRKFIKQYIKDLNIHSLVDFGCGPAIEYYNLKNDNYNITYLGVDSCLHIKELHEKNNVPFLYSNVEESGLNENMSELSYTRHVLEHLPTYSKLLDEMIRISSKYIVVIFFIKPSNEERINFNAVDNLYHNMYNKSDIEHFIDNKISTYRWFDINDKEIALIMEK